TLDAGRSGPSGPGSGPETMSVTAGGARRHTVGVLRSGLVWRRAVTAAATYGSVAAGVLGTLIAARELGPHDFGRLAIVISAAGFFQILLDLTVEEAMIKFGFRYSESQQWGRLRRLFRQAL